MKSNLNKLLAVFFSVGILSTFLVTNVHAQFFPPFLESLIFTDNPAGFIGNRTQVAFVLAIGGLIILAVISGIIIAGKLINQRDKSEELESGATGVKNIAAGFGILFGVLLVIASVIVFFGGNVYQLTPHAICIEGPDSVGCYACKNSTLYETGSEDTTDNRTTCEICDLDTDAQIDDRQITVREDYDLVMSDDTDLQLEGTCLISVSEVRENAANADEHLQNPKQADL